MIRLVLSVLLFSVLSNAQFVLIAPTGPLPGKQNVYDIHGNFNEYNMISKVCGKNGCHWDDKIKQDCDTAFKSSKLTASGLQTNLAMCPKGFKSWGFCKQIRSFWADKFLRVCRTISDFKTCGFTKDEMHKVFDRPNYKPGYETQCLDCYKQQCINNNKFHTTAGDAWETCMKTPKCTFVMKHAGNRFYLRSALDFWKAKAPGNCKTRRAECRIAAKGSSPKPIAPRKTKKKKFKLMPKNVLCPAEEHILYVKECQEALLWIKESNKKATDGTFEDRAWGNRPYGCFLHTGATNGYTKTNQVKFNNNPNRGRKNKGDQQICVSMSAEEEEEEEELADILQTLMLLRD